MKRLGLFSGHVYDENESDSLNECCLMLTDKNANDKDYIQQWHSMSIRKCMKCLGCPVSQAQSKSVNNP